MLQPSTLKFLKDLSKNNNKPWFEDHRKQFESAKADLAEMVTFTIKHFETFDKPIAALETKNCLFRINRDVRFSKDKTPYKNNLAAYFNKHGKKGIGAGYYLHIQPGKSFVAGGIWMPEPNVLGKIRQEIDYNLDEWEKMFRSKNFKNNFPNGLETDGSLSRPPKGYSHDNPGVQYLKMKNFIVSCPIDDEQIINKNFIKLLITKFKAMKPLLDFLNKAID
ncbi:MAG: DUF2461 domain-containing protein [Ferruginibacter sp.]